MSRVHTPFQLHSFVGSAEIHVAVIGWGVTGSSVYFTAIRFSLSVGSRCGSSAIPGLRFWEPSDLRFATIRDSVLLRSGHRGSLNGGSQWGLKATLCNLHTIVYNCALLWPFGASF